MSEKPENVRSLVSSLPKSLLVRILCVCVFARTHVFVCLPCHCWPKLKPQECEITSTRGISRLCRAEKICFCQTTQSISIPDKLCLLQLLAAYPFPIQSRTIKPHHYIYIYVGSHGYSVSRFAYATPLTRFIAVINCARCIVWKDKQPLFLFRGQTCWQEINARVPMST